MEFLTLLLNTILLRPYVFAFLAAALFCAQRLIGWRRTGRFFVITWVTALLCELSSTRNGFPFGLYHYTMATKGQELYISNVPFMDSVSFPFLLYASYCMALAFLLPAQTEPAPKRAANWQLISLSFRSPMQSSWTTMGLTALFYVWVDMVLDPVALRGDQWFLGHIYDYAEPGVHFGVPLTNYLGWATLGLISLGVYFALDRRFPVKSGNGNNHWVTGSVVLGCGLYYGVLAFILAVAFRIGESLLGTIGILMYIPITALLVLRLTGRMPAQRLIVRTGKS